MQPEPADIPTTAPDDPRLAVLGQFLACLSHDLRNPLTAIRNLIHFLRGSVPATPEVVESLDMIEGEVKEMNTLLTRLMEIAHEWRFDPSEVELEPLLTETAAQVDRNQRYAWRYELKNAAPAIWCDRVRFQQVLRNLLQNAVTAMQGRGKMQITAWREPTCDLIEIRDSGPGIPDPVRDRLFEPFVTTKLAGMGLGLVYCSRIVEQHGGTIVLHESSRNGAAFRISLPRKPETGE